MIFHYLKCYGFTLTVLVANVSINKCNGHNNDTKLVKYIKHSNSKCRYFSKDMAQLEILMIFFDYHIQSIISLYTHFTEM